MEPLNNVPSTYNAIPEQTSFSFDHPQPHDLPKRTINNCLRLKTNESLDGRASVELTKQNKKYLRTQESQIQNDQHYRRLAQEEYDMRTQSLVKQYELRISKQEEYYGLREWKLKEQIENLTNQNILLTDQLRKVKMSTKTCQQRCSLCGDGQILKNYNKILSEAEEHHKNCLVEKKELFQKVDQAMAKYATLEEQHDKVCQDVRSLSRQIRLYQKKVRQLEDQKDAAVESVAQLDSKWKEKFQKLESDSRQLQRLVYQKDMELKQNRAVAQSRQSLPMTQQQQSLKSSFIRQDRRDQKQNINARNRTSVPKMMGITDDYAYEKREALENGKDVFNRMRVPKHEPLRWKYF